LRQDISRAISDQFTFFRAVTSVIRTSSSNFEKAWRCDERPLGASEDPDRRPDADFAIDIRG
jgi:hypothetical protein